jgi:hypothetical protein
MMNLFSFILCLCVGVLMFYDESYKAACLLFFIAGMNLVFLIIKMDRL